MIEDLDVTLLSDHGRLYMFGWLEATLQSKGRIGKADWRKAYEAAEADDRRRRQLVLS